MKMKVEMKRYTLNRIDIILDTILIYTEESHGVPVFKVKNNMLYWFTTNQKVLDHKLTLKVGEYLKQNLKK